VIYTLVAVVPPCEKASSIRACKPASLENEKKDGTPGYEPNQSNCSLVIVKKSLDTLNPPLC